MVKPDNIFSPLDDAIEAQALAQAEADFAAGRILPHESVKAWLRSWGGPDELPKPSPDNGGGTDPGSEAPRPPSR
jgi:hypothetical protein